MHPVKSMKIRREAAIISIAPLCGNRTGGTRLLAQFFKCLFSISESSAMVKGLLMLAVKP